MDIPEFKERRVKHEVLDVCYEDLKGVDRFITESADESWRQKITQAQDVFKWIKDPSQIAGIQSNLQHLKRIIKNMDKPVSILDVGCYAGYIYDYISKFVINNVSDLSYIGLDNRGFAIEGARKAHKEARNAKFTVGDIYKLKETFAKDNFDLIFCSRVLIHIPFFEEAISNLLHVAKKMVFTILRIEKKPCCKKMQKIDLDTGSKMIYFYRSFSPKMIRQVAKDNSVRCRVLRSREWYSSIVFYKTMAGNSLFENVVRSFFKMKTGTTVY